MLLAIGWSHCLQPPNIASPVCLSAVQVIKDGVADFSVPVATKGGKYKGELSLSVAFKPVGERVSLAVRLTWGPYVAAAQLHLIKPQVGSGARKQRKPGVFEAAQGVQHDCVLLNHLPCVCACVNAACTASQARTRPEPMAAAKLRQH